MISRGYSIVGEVEEVVYVYGCSSEDGTNMAQKLIEVKYRKVQN